MVWSNQQVLRQHIYVDTEFIESALLNVEVFVKQCIIPELIGKWFTRPDATSQEHDFPHSSTSVASYSPTSSIQDIATPCITNYC